MRKFWAALLTAVLIVPMLFQTQAQAAVKFNILIDGVRLATKQAPVMIQGRVVLPMRSIFEALDAKVTWNQRAKTVTAVKDGTRIVLKINSKTATINNKSVRLDVPAKNLRGTTMVPVRFVSEALGEKVGWNSRTKTVSITTTSGGEESVPPSTSFYPASSVTVKDIANNGDGRDLQVNFSKSASDSRVSQYRVMMVKSENSNRFNESAARMVAPSNYSIVYPTGYSNTVTLNSSSRDVDGDYIRGNQAYKVYVLAAGKYNGEYALSSPSSTITLSNSNAVDTASNVKANDISDYGDGRDLSVSFSRAQNDNLVSNYRVMVVKTKDAHNFNLSAAKSVPSQYYTTVYKTSGTTLTTNLSSSTRDTNGDYIRNGVPYTVFVMSVSSNENSLASKLSSGSSSITLATGSSSAPSITSVSDVSNYGDGRDLRINFNRQSDESSVGSYRIFVVKSSDYHNFNLNKAESVSSYNYTQVNKTGNNIQYTLSSGARDVDGSSIRNGVYYRVFVMSVGTGNNSNKLSSASSEIILSNNNGNGGSYVGSVSNLSVRDYGDYNDGRDLEVSFNRPSDDYNISHYRAFVVKSHKASDFDLYDAERLSSYYYTDIYKTGSNKITKSLSSGSRDTDGDYIRSGTEYRVFILSVGNSSYSGNNALSSYSSTITLSGNRNVVKAVSNLNVKDSGRDLEVSFTRASDEYNISHYRALFVKSSKVGNFKLNDANNSKYYTDIYKTGSSNITKSLSYDSRDTDGDPIRNGGSYRLYILSVGNSNYSGDNAMTSYGSITLANNSKVAPVSNVKVEDVSDYNTGLGLKVSFERPSNDSNISHYLAYVVKSNKADNFNLSTVGSSSSTKIDKTNSTITLSSSSLDSEGKNIESGVKYFVFIRSVGNGNGYSDAMTSVAPNITLANKNKAAPVTNLNVESVSDNNNGQNLKVSFDRPSEEDNIDHYRVFVINTGTTGNFRLKDANSINDIKRYYGIDKTTNTGKTISETVPSAIKDTDGADIKEGTYRIFVLSVSSKSVENNTLFGYKEITLTNKTPVTPVSAPLNVKATVDDNNTSITVRFDAPNSAVNVEEYRAMFVPFGRDFKLSNANAVSDKKNYRVIEATKNESILKLTDKLYDVDGKELSKYTSYTVYVLAVDNGQGPGENAISKSSEVFRITDTSQARDVQILPITAGNANFQVSFESAIAEENITSYEVLIVPAITAENKLDIKNVSTLKPAITEPNILQPKQPVNNFSVTIDTDAFKNTIIAGEEYKVIVLSINNASGTREISAVSKPSSSKILLAK